MTFDTKTIVNAKLVGWIWRAVVFAATITTACAVGQATTLAQSELDWLSNRDGQPVFHFRVEVESADGAVAADCVVTANSRGQSLPVTSKDDTRFITLCPADIKDFYNFRIIAKSADGKQIGHLLVPIYQVRQLARDGITLRLVPARTIEIRVTHGNVALPDANVELDGVLTYPIKMTDENGIARFVVPADNTISSIAAWTTGTRIVGAIDMLRMRESQTTSNEFQLELVKCRDLKIVVKDSAGKPIPSIDMRIRASKPAPSYHNLPYGDLRNVKTDENGEAVFHWMPNWEDYRLIVSPESDDWQLDSREENATECVVELKPIDRRLRKTVKGKIELPPGEPGGFLLTAHTFQAEQEGRSDSSCAFVDESGNYELSVLPGSTYSVYVNDARWGSNIWDGLIYDPATDVVTLPEVRCVKSVPVEIVATQGYSKKPMRNLSINMANPHRYSWLEDGHKQNGNAERRWFAQTDEHGIAKTFTTPGVVKASVYLPDWRTELTTETQPGETTRIELHRSTEGSQSIRGVVFLPKKESAALENFEVVAYAADGESSGKAETTTSAQGEFEINLPGKKIAYLVTSPDGKFSASGVTSDLNQLRLGLEPCVTYKGQLVNQDGEPLPNCRFSIEANISFPNGDLGLASSFAAKKFETTTDEKGDFEFSDCIPTNIKLKCRVETPDGRSHYIETLFFEPAEVRARQLVTISDRVKTPSANFSLSRIFNSKTNDARLINAHVLIAIHQDDEQLARFVDSNCLNDDNNRDILRYLTIQIDPSRTESSVDAEFLAGRNWKIPGENELLILATDPSGKELGKLQINIGDEGVTDKVATFIADHVPVQKDARIEFASALAEAKRTDRKVWARVCQTRCGPCFLLSRWIDKNREQLQKEFVLYKVDNVNEKNGMEVYKQIVPETGLHGVPFHAVFDAEGNKLIDSCGPLGNIGFPGSSFESRKHLAKMLSIDLEHLNQEEIQAVVDSLK